MGAFPLALLLDVPASAWPIVSAKEAWFCGVRGNPGLLNAEFEVVDGAASTFFLPIWIRRGMFLVPLSLLKANVLGVIGFMFSIPGVSGTVYATLRAVFGASSSGE